MSMEYLLEEKTITIDENNYLLIKTKTEENYLWDEVYLINNGLEIFVGAYSKDRYSEQEWMEYNSNYIVFVKNQFGYGEEYIDYRDDDYGYLGKKIIKVFDIKNKETIMDKDRVFDIYNKEFNNTDRLFYNSNSFPARKRTID